MTAAITALEPLLPLFWFFRTVVILSFIITQLNQ
jgi:hypothetical protein